MAGERAARYALLGVGVAKNALSEATEGEGVVCGESDLAAEKCWYHLLG